MTAAACRRANSQKGGAMLKILGRKTSSNVQKVLWCCGEIGLPVE
jgi:hypothetical protein